ncbi:MAG: GlsB/YeaQ/YmgE family stress response membrane protein [Burkholderiales bacterium]|nr:GlsB/YeaQ/YmgE family stress response membrane protein [Burkholderiales bacterium]
MHYVWMAIVGLIVGAIARFVTPGEQKMGWIMTSVLGIAGSLVAGIIGQAVHWYEPGQPAGWIASVVGAVVLLFIYDRLRGGGRS